MCVLLQAIHWFLLPTGSLGITACAVMMLSISPVPSPGRKHWAVLWSWRLTISNCGRRHARSHSIYGLITLTDLTLPPHPQYRDLRRVIERRGIDRRLCDARLIIPREVRRNRDDLLDSQVPVFAQVIERV